MSFINEDTFKSKDQYTDQKSETMQDYIKFLTKTKLERRKQVVIDSSKQESYLKRTSSINFYS